MTNAGRPKKYKTNKALSREIDKYFDSISKTEELSEVYVTGKDKKGKDILARRAVLNDNGEPIKNTRWLSPPTITGMCLFLGISRQTFDTYCKEAEFLDTTTRARTRIENYLEQQLYRDKGVNGIIFNLSNNFGWKDKKEIDLGKETRQGLAVQNMTMDEKMALIAEATRDFAAADNKEGCGNGDENTES